MITEMASSQSITDNMADLITFSLVWPLRVKQQAFVERPPELVFCRSQSFKELSVDAVTTVPESKNFT